MWQIVVAKISHAAQLINSFDGARNNTQISDSVFFFYLNIQTRYTWKNILSEKKKWHHVYAVRSVRVWCAFFFLLFFYSLYLLQWQTDGRSNAWNKNKNSRKFSNVCHLHVAKDVRRAHRTCWLVKKTFTIHCHFFLHTKVKHAAFHTCNSHEKTKLFECAQAVDGSTDDVENWMCRSECISVNIECRFEKTNASITAKRNIVLELWLK